jgi:hypothetical protein
VPRCLHVFQASQSFPPVFFVGSNVVFKVHRRPVTAFAFAVAFAVEALAVVALAVVALAVVTLAVVALAVVGVPVKLVLIVRRVFWEIAVASLHAAAPHRPTKRNAFAALAIVALAAATFSAFATVALATFAALAIVALAAFVVVALAVVMLRTRAGNDTWCWRWVAINLFSIFTFAASRWWYLWAVSIYGPRQAGGRRGGTSADFGLEKVWNGLGHSKIFRRFWA